MSYNLILQQKIERYLDQNNITTIYNDKNIKEYIIILMDYLTIYKKFNYISILSYLINEFPNDENYVLNYIISYYYEKKIDMGVIFQAFLSDFIKNKIPIILSYYDIFILGDNYYIFQFIKCLHKNNIYPLDFKIILGYIIRMDLNFDVNILEYINDNNMLEENDLYILCMLTQNIQGIEYLLSNIKNPSYEYILDNISSYNTSVKKYIINKLGGIKAFLYILDNYILNQFQLMDYIFDDVDIFKFYIEYIMNNIPDFNERLSILHNYVSDSIFNKKTFWDYMNEKNIITFHIINIFNQYKINNDIIRYVLFDINMIKIFTNNITGFTKTFFSLVCKDVIEIIINQIGIKKFYIYINRRRSIVTKFLINKENFNLILNILLNSEQLLIPEYEKYYIHLFYILLDIKKINSITYLDFKKDDIDMIQNNKIKDMILKDFNTEMYRVNSKYYNMIRNIFENDIIQLNSIDIELSYINNIKIYEKKKNKWQKEKNERISEFKVPSLYINQEYNLIHKKYNVDREEYIYYYSLYHTMVKLHLRELNCGINRLSQTSGTCWLNSILNGMILTTNFKNRIIQYIETCIERRILNYDVLEIMTNNNTTCFKTDLTIYNKKTIAQYIISILYSVFCKTGVRTKTDIMNRLVNLVNYNLDIDYNTDLDFDITHKDNMNDYSTSGSKFLYKNSLEVIFKILNNFMHRCISPPNIKMNDDIIHGNTIELFDTFINIIFIDYNANNNMYTIIPGSDMKYFINNINISASDPSFNLIKPPIPGLMNINDINMIDIICCNFNNTTSIPKEIICTDKNNGNMIIFKLEYAILRINWEYSSIGHQISCFICNGEYYIWDSNNYYYKADWTDMKNLTIINNVFTHIYGIDDMIKSDITIKYYDVIYTSTNKNFNHMMGDNCMPIK